VAATALVDRVAKDLIGLSDSPQDVIEMRTELWMVTQDLVPP